MPDQDICVGESQCLFAAWRTREAFANIEMGTQAGEGGGCKKRMTSNHFNLVYCVF